MNDPQLEKLLRDFFHAEMPAALRGEDAALRAQGQVRTPAVQTPVTNRAASTANGAVRLRPATDPTMPTRGTAAVAVVAACTMLLAVGALWWTPAGRSPNETSATRGGTPAPVAVQSSGETADQRLPLAGDGEVLRGVETFPQPVEQRGTAGGNTIEHVDNRGGTTIESEFPELEIEVRPIEK